MNHMLAHAGIFRNRSSDLLVEFVKKLETVTFHRGEVIFIEGEPGDKLYIVITGKVKIGRRSADGRDILIALMGPLDIFGEIAIFDPILRSSTVTALSQVKLIMIDSCKLKNWLISKPEVCVYLLQIIAYRLRFSNNFISDQIFTDVPGRLARQLIYLGKKFGSQFVKDDTTKVHVNHELTQEEIAQLVGSSRETINKTLSDFTKRGWIHLQSRSIVINDMNKLAKRAS